MTSFFVFDVIVSFLCLIFGLPAPVALEINHDVWFLVFRRIV